MPPPMAAEVTTPARKVAQVSLDVRPGSVQRIYGRKRAPLNFEQRALEVLQAPCSCDMCRGVPKARDRKQVSNLRHDLGRNRFKRAVVMCRDGWKCRACGTEDELTIDHIRQLAHGGTNAYHNLQVLCVDCHIAKPDSHEPRFLARHLANLVEGMLPFIDPVTAEDQHHLRRVKRMIDLIRGEEIA
jgi:5-methylcytosine-specific restriction endonuclease McrA